MKKSYVPEATGIEAIIQKGIAIAWKGGIPLGILGTAVIFSPLYLGNNKMNEITVVQHVTGKMVVHTTAGPYFKGLATKTVYPKVISMDHDRSEAASGATIDQPGIAVRYQAGGEGTVYGTSQYSLPTGKAQMLKVHETFGNADGVAYRLIKPAVENGMTLTAGLMKSEEAFNTKRAVFAQWAKDQIANGPYKTKSVSVTTTDPISGKTVVTQIPQIIEVNGLKQHDTSDLQDYGITVVGFRLGEPGFEKSTTDQIADKRKITMDIITSKAKAKLAKQATDTAEEEGLAKVMTAKYEEEVLKERAIVAAERSAEVAIIKAEQKVSVAEQELLEAAQRNLASVEYKEEQINIGTGEAERKRLIFEADGSLEIKLDAIVEMNKNYATALGKNKLVPEITMGGTEGNTNSAMSLVDMLMVKTAKDLSVDISHSVQDPRPIK